MTWTKCSDKMPPDDETKVIVSSEFFHEYIAITGKEVHLAKIIDIDLDDKWAPYTPELWGELNK